MSFYLNLILCIILLHSTSVFAYNKSTCRIPNDLIFAVQNRFNLTLKNTNVNITYDLDNVSTTMLPENVVQLLVNTTSVSFASNFSSKEQPTRQLIIDFDTQHIIAYKIQFNENTELCKIQPTTNFGIRLYLNNSNEEEAIYQLTQYCIQNLLCDNFDSIVVLKNEVPRQEIDVTTDSSHYSNDDLIKNITNRNENVTVENANNTIQDENITILNGNYTVEQKNNEVDNGNNTVDNTNNTVDNDDLSYGDSCNDYFGKVYNSQNTINAFMDFGVSVLISKLDTTKTGVFNIPEINESFSVGFWLPTGYITTSKGEFWGLRKLNRVSNIALTYEDHRLSVGSTYSLSNAKVTFSSYNVKFGFINISGDISAEINKLTAKVKASFDYNNKPCQADLNDFDIYGLDELDIQITGLAVLNGAAASVIKEIIRSNAVDSLKQALIKKLNELDCERFRFV